MFGAASCGEGRGLTCLEVVDDAVGLHGEVGEARDVEEEHAVRVEVRPVREGHQLLLRLVVLRLVGDGAQVLMMVVMMMLMIIMMLLLLLFRLLLCFSALSCFLCSNEKKNNQ